MKDSQREVLDFWFVETAPAQWFQKNDQFDTLVKSTFLTVYEMARQGLCESWMKDADGCLALCIVLDQFPRNMFRNTPRAYEADEQARQAAGHAIKKGFDQVLPPYKRRFIYLPFEHSESLDHQMLSLELFEKMQDDDPLGVTYAKRHLEIIRRFGRFPHRNSILGRPSTEAELAYLADLKAG